MTSLLAAMHALAARRGEGLHPKLAKLLEGSKPAPQPDRAAPGDNLAPPEPGPREQPHASRPERARIAAGAGAAPALLRHVAGPDTVIDR